MYTVIIHDLEDDESIDYQEFKLLEDAEAYARKVAEDQFYDCIDYEMPSAEKAQKRADLTAITVFKAISRFTVNPKPIVDKEVIK